MEDNNKIVKVYSNNSKKSRLKRGKNKFQRIWNAEKQAYIKVRKAKYPTIVKAKKDWREVDDSAALKRRHETPKSKKSVPVNAAQMEKKIAEMNKPETKQNTHNVHGKITSPARVEKAKTLSLYGGKVNLVWDSKNLKYRNAA